MHPVRPVHPAHPLHPAPTNKTRNPSRSTQRPAPTATTHKPARHPSPRPARIHQQHRTQRAPRKSPRNLQQIPPIHHKMDPAIPMYPPIPKPPQRRTARNKRPTPSNVPATYPCINCTVPIWTVLLFWQRSGKPGNRPPFLPIKGRFFLEMRVFTR